MYFIVMYIIVLHFNELDSTSVLYLEITLSSENKHQVKHSNEQTFERRLFPAQKLKQESHTLSCLITDDSKFPCSAHCKQPGTIPSRDLDIAWWP